MEKKKSIVKGSMSVDVDAEFKIRCAWPTLLQSQFLQLYVSMVCNTRVISLIHYQRDWKDQVAGITEKRQPLLICNSYIPLMARVFVGIACTFFYKQVILQ